MRDNTQPNQSQTELDKCVQCGASLTVAPADYSVRHLYCDNVDCPNYSLLAIRGIQENTDDR